MSRWLTGEPICTGRRTWRFRHGARFEWGQRGAGWIVEIPASFEFDVSAPWWLTWLPVLKAMIRPAGLHDLLRRDPAWALWSGDLMFLDACKANGVREPWLTLGWWAVRTNDRRD